MTRGCIAVAIALAIAACGGDDGGGDDGGGDPGDPVSTEEMNATCTDFSTHASTCGWGGNINGADWNCGEAAIVWRADVFRAVASCAIDLPCTGDGSACIQLAYDTTPLPIHDDYAATCTSRKAECGLVGTSDASTIILFCQADTLAPYANPIMDSILACFDAACADVVPCLGNVL